MSGRAITITEKRYNELMRKEQELDHLHALGVDNWEGYQLPFEEEEEEGEDFDDPTDQP